MLDFFDDSGLAFTALLTIGMQLSFFAVAYTCKFDTVTDFAGGANFTLLAILTLVVGEHFFTRQIVVTVMVAISRTELGLFLLYRVLQRGKDDRFDEIRENFKRFLFFWIFQMLWVWGVSLPLIFLNTAAENPDLGAADYAGWAMFVIGFAIQVVADIQKFRFKANPANRKKICNTGVWALTRHPNYFGEILLWWGIFVACTPVFSPSSRSWGYATIVSPLETMALLLFLSGMPTAEGRNQARFYQDDERRGPYIEYRNKTPPLIPFIPAVYKSLPKIVKQVFCFEFRMYEYREADKGSGVRTASSQTNRSAASAANAAQKKQH